MDNAFDKNAHAVWLAHDKGYHVGYISKNKAAELTNILKSPTNLYYSRHEHMLVGYIINKNPHKFRIVGYALMSDAEKIKDRYYSDLVQPFK
jgi:hypothetical protein